MQHMQNFRRIFVGCKTIFIYYTSTCVRNGFKLHWKGSPKTMSIQGGEFSMLQQVFQQSANSCATMAYPFLHSHTPKFSFRIPYVLFWVPIGIRLDSIGIHIIIHRYSGFIQYDFHLRKNNWTKIAKNSITNKIHQWNPEAPGHQHHWKESDPPTSHRPKHHMTTWLRCHGRVYLQPGMPWPQSIV